MLFYFHVIAESVPISSSGHYTLLAKIFKIHDLSEYKKYLLHVPSVFIILFFLYNNLSLISNYRLFHLLKLVFIANSFTILIYLVLNSLKCKNLKKLPLWVGFLATAILLLSLKVIKFNSYNQLDFTIAILVGLAQGIALLPGISRLGITYFMGVLLQLNPLVSLYFSLLIEAPLILAAIILPVISSNISYNNILNKNQKKILCRPDFSLIHFVIILISMFTSYYLLDLIKTLAKNNLLYLFGYYMFIPTTVAYLSNFFKNPKNLKLKI